MAFLSGKKQPKYRGFKVPVPLEMLLALRAELESGSSHRHIFTCNALGRIAVGQAFNRDIEILNDSHAEVYNGTQQKWTDFLSKLGIATSGSGFTPELWRDEGRPDFLEAMHNSDMSPNGLRLAFINDILKRAFKHA